MVVKSQILRDYGNCNKNSFWNIGNEYRSNEDKDLGCSVQFGGYSQYNEEDSKECRDDYEDLDVVIDLPP